MSIDGNNNINGKLPEARMVYGIQIPKENAEEESTINFTEENNNEVPQAHMVYGIAFAPDVDTILPTNKPESRDPSDVLKKPLPQMTEEQAEKVREKLDELLDLLRDVSGAVLKKPNIEPEE